RGFQDARRPNETSRRYPSGGIGRPHAGGARTPPTSLGAPGAGLGIGDQRTAVQHHPLVATGWPPDPRAGAFLDPVGVVAAGRGESTQIAAKRRDQRVARRIPGPGLVRGVGGFATIAPFDRVAQAVLLLAFPLLVLDQQILPGGGAGIGAQAIAGGQAVLLSVAPGRGHIPAVAEDPVAQAGLALSGHLRVDLLGGDPRIAVL